MQLEGIAMEVLQLIATYGWPVAVGYIGYVHRELAALSARIYNLESDMAKNYVPKNDVVALENRLVSMLNRIDDKVTRILEGR
jgi:hypothetical protein